MNPLEQWATPIEAEYLRALDEHGSIEAAAKALNRAHSSVSRGLKRVKLRAAQQGHSPEHDMTHTVPDGFRVRGVSTLYGEDGKPKVQWVKSQVDNERREELIRAAIAALSEEIKGLAPITPPPERVSADFLNVIPMGDPHFGLYSWAKETGEAFDTTLARNLTLGAVDRLMEAAPAADTAIVLPLGDVFHANDQTNVTPAHKHQLDVDSRFVKVLGIGIETYRHVILRALEKHNRVIVRFVSGNHDPSAVWALAFTIAAYFDNDHRVEVDLSPSKFWFHRFGKVLIGATHGDTVRHEALPGVMASDRAEDWGQTKHRYWYTGHVHHTVVKEFPGVVCESFRTLAARDAYSAGHGYRAGRDMVCIVHHREHGETERHRCDVGMMA